MSKIIIINIYTSLFFSSLLAFHHRSQQGNFCRLVFLIDDYKGASSSSEILFEVYKMFFIILFQIWSIDELLYWAFVPKIHGYCYFIQYYIWFSSFCYLLVHFLNNWLEIVHYQKVGLYFILKSVQLEYLASSLLFIFVI